VKTGIPGIIAIAVDDREVRSSVPDILRGREDVVVSVRRLPLGDYEIDGGLLIERKTLLDLAQSLKDGRLFRQAWRLAEAPQRGIVILEGTSRDLVSSGMRREALQGALITLSVFLGLPLLRSQDAAETARLMVYAGRQGRALARGGLPRHGMHPKGKRGLQFHILQGLPGIGPERARRLLEAFGTVEAIITAEEEALCEVTGVGQGTAKAIRWAVQERRADYGWLPKIE